jgi:hypothetical protein
LELREGVAPDVQEGRGGEGLDQEGEVAFEDAQRLIELRGDGEMIRIVYQVSEQHHIVSRHEMTYLARQLRQLSSSGL